MSKLIHLRKQPVVDEKKPWPTDNTVIVEIMKPFMTETNGQKTFWKPKPGLAVLCRIAFESGWLEYEGDTSNPPKFYFDMIRKQEISVEDILPRIESGHIRLIRGESQPAIVPPRKPLTPRQKWSRRDWVNILAWNPKWQIGDGPVRPEDK